MHCLLSTHLDVPKWHFDKLIAIVQEVLIKPRLRWLEQCEDRHDTLGLSALEVPTTMTVDRSQVPPLGKVSVYDEVAAIQPIQPSDISAR